MKPPRHMVTDSVASRGLVQAVHPVAADISAISSAAADFCSVIPMPPVAAELSAISSAVADFSAPAAGCVSDTVLDTSAEEVGMATPMSGQGGISPVLALSARGSARPSKEDIIAFGGIVDPAKTAVRSSDRIRSQPTADASAMERAMLLAQRRDGMIG